MSSKSWCCLAYVDYDPDVSSIRSAIIILSFSPFLASFLRFLLDSFASIICPVTCNSLILTTPSSRRHTLQLALRCTVCYNVHSVYDLEVLKT